MMYLALASIAAFFSTLLGGLFALHLKDRLHLILGFSAGAVIGVAFFDLIPEALELGAGHFETGTIISVMAIGFLLYLIFDRLVFFHHHDDHNGGEETSHSHSANRGILGAGSLSIHSFLDGVAMGVAFQVSVSVGLVVALAVLAHDFSDGINTVNMISKGGGSQREAFRWLLLDAFAPVLGVLSTFLFTLSSKWLGLLLALFSGFFLYIGASDLLPESHHRHPKFWTTSMTLLGALLLYGIVSLAGI